METEDKPTNQQIDEGSMIELQPSLVARFCKQRLKDHIISGDFRKEFSKAMSLFVHYVQSFQTKKNYTQDDLINTLEKRGMENISERLVRTTISNKKESREKNLVPPVANSQLLEPETHN